LAFLAKPVTDIPIIRRGDAGFFLVAFRRFFETKAETKRRRRGQKNGPLPGADLFGQLPRRRAVAAEPAVRRTQRVQPGIVYAGERWRFLGSPTSPER